jgi:hypothetical protein
MKVKAKPEIVTKRPGDWRGGEQQPGRYLHGQGANE